MLNWRSNHARSISIASFAAPVFMLILCIVYALSAGRVAAPAADRQTVSRTARWSIWAVAASVLLVAALDWRATRADVASWFAQQAAAKQPQLGEQLIEEADTPDAVRALLSAATGV